MICFPLDITGYEAKALGAWCGTRTRGVFSDDAHYFVTPNGDMSVTVSPGLAWLKQSDLWGVVAFEENAQVFTLDQADGSLSRIDAVCIRLDRALNQASLVIKKGAYSPQPPAITPPARDADYDEIYIATVMVRAGAVSILASDITDQRLNEEYCGVVRDGVTGIPTQGLHDQFMAWFATVETVLDENVAAHLLNLINALTSRVDTIETDMPAKSTVTTATLLASAWSGTRPYTQTVSVAGVTSTGAWEILPTLDVTQEQLEALQGANLQDGGQTGGSITLKAFGDKPGVDLPVRIIVRGDL